LLARRGIERQRFRNRSRETRGKGR
jgi:hypothetical protein